jgi:hypothetical protein
MIPVLRYGKIYNYDITYGDRCWDQKEYFQAASLYATCMAKGYTSSESYTLAYMYITKEREPELQYGSLHMQELKKIMDHVEKA